MNKKIIFTGILSLSLLTYSALAADIHGDNIYADAGDVYIKDTSPGVKMTDTTYSATTHSWGVFGFGNAFLVRDYTGGGSSREAIDIATSTNNLNSLHVNSSGDINLANGSVFIDRSANKMGIGTTAPGHALDVVGAVGSDGLWVKGPSPMIQGWLSPDYYGLVTVGTDTAARLPLLINRESKTNLRVDVGGVMVGWSDSNTIGDGATQLLTLSANNAAAGKTSDAGFSMENVGKGFTWTFRTYDPAEGFIASKIGTGGPEFEVSNTTASHDNAVVKMGGVTVFTGGHLVTASSRTLKTDIKPLDTQAALDAFHQLQPVSFAYKAHQGEPVVGFIAEDMPELVAMPSRKSFDSAEVVAVLTSVLAETRAELKLAQEKIAKLETMQKKVAMMESILTNLALESSASDKAKVSMK